VFDMKKRHTKIVKHQARSINVPLITTILVEPNKRTRGEEAQRDAGDETHNQKKTTRKMGRSTRTGGGISSSNEALQSKTKRNAKTRPVLPHTKIAGGR